MNDKTISTSVGAIVEKILEKAPNKPNYLEIFSNWQEIVGKYLSEVSSPHKVTPIGSSKVLVLKAKKGYSLEIQHDSPNILDAVNNFLGGEFFHHLRVLQMDVNESLT